MSTAKTAKATTKAATSPSAPVPAPDEAQSVTNEVEASHRVLVNTDAAIAELTRKITSARNEIDVHQDVIAEIETRLAASLAHIAELESQITEQEDRVRQSKNFAFLSSGSAGMLEREASETYQIAMAQLEQLQEELAATRNQYASAEHSELKLKREHLAALAEIEGDITKLTAEQVEMQAIREQVWQALGEATMNALIEQIKEADQEYDRIEQERINAGDKLWTLQKSIQSRLADWQSLANECQERYGRKAEPKRTATTAILEKYAAYLKELGNLHRLATTRNVNQSRLVWLLTLDEATIRSALNPNNTTARSELSAARVAEVQNWLAEHKGEVQSGLASDGGDWWYQYRYPVQR